MGKPYRQAAVATFGLGVRFGLLGLICIVLKKMATLYTRVH